MFVIGLTGGTASGKSFVLKEFAKHFPVIDCDAIVAELYKKEEIKEKIKHELKTTNKKKLAEIVFSSKEKRQKLEQILHPEVIKEINKQKTELEKQGEKTVIIDIPLLFEASLEKTVDKIVVVSASIEQQRERLLAKGFSAEEAEQRIDAQLPIEKKIKRAHYIIDNSSTTTNTKKQIKELIKEFKKLWKKK